MAASSTIPNYLLLNEISKVSWRDYLSSWSRVVIFREWYGAQLVLLLPANISSFIEKHFVL